jgi:hypothetical protein
MCNWCGWRAEPEAEPATTAKAERLARVRGALAGKLVERRGFVARELPSGQLLEQRIPNESWVDEND